MAGTARAGWHKGCSSGSAHRPSSPRSPRSSTRIRLSRRRSFPAVAEAPGGSMPHPCSASVPTSKDSLSTQAHAGRLGAPNSLPSADHSRRSAATVPADSKS